MNLQSAGATCLRGDREKKPGTVASRELASSKPTTKPRAAALTVTRSSCYLFCTNYLHMFAAASPSRLTLPSEPEERCGEDSWQSDGSILSCSHYNAVSRFPSTPRSEVQTLREISSRDVKRSADSWPVCDHTFRFRLKSNQE